jgi:hypothetical protein
LDSQDQYVHDLFDGPYRKFVTLWTQLRQVNLHANMVDDIIRNLAPGGQILGFKILGAFKILGQLLP